AAAEDGAVAIDTQAADLRIRGPEPFQLRGSGVEQAQVPVALLIEGADDPARRGESVGRHPKDPLRRAEFRLAIEQRFRAAVFVTIEVPPSSAVGDEMKPAVRRPLGLEDRFGGSSGNPAALAQLTQRADIGQPELGAVPWHVRVIPLQPGELASVRTEP